MPRNLRNITRDDILPLAQYELIRADNPLKADGEKPRPPFNTPTIDGVSSW